MRPVGTTITEWLVGQSSAGLTAVALRAGLATHEGGSDPLTGTARGAQIVHLRWKQRLGLVEIGDRLNMPSSTVHTVLVRCRINRLTHIDRATGEPIRRYEKQRPGDLIHVDVKKLGKVPDGGGWRYVGREQGNRNRSATSERAGTPRNRWRNPLIGTCYLHTVIDDHSRVAYVEAHDDETKETATEALRYAVA